MNTNKQIALLLHEIAAQVEHQLEAGDIDFNISFETDTVLHMSRIEKRPSTLKTISITGEFDLTGVLEEIEGADNEPDTGTE